MSNTFFNIDEDYVEIFGDDIDYNVLYSKVKNIKNECDHLETYQDINGLQICRSCGIEQENEDNEPEWRYFNENENRLSKNPERCRMIKNSNLTTIEDCRRYFPAASEAIISLAVSKFNIISANETSTRGNTRKAVLAACLFFAFYDRGESKPSEYITKKFNITQKNMSKGLEMYWKTFREYRTKVIKPKDLIKWVLTSVGIDIKYLNEILKLVSSLSKKSFLLESCSPQSVASAMVFFWLCLNPKIKSKMKITKNSFSKSVGISDITVSKLVKETNNIAKVFMKL